MSDISNRPDFQFLAWASRIVMQKALAHHKALLSNTDKNKNQTPASNSNPRSDCYDVGKIIYFRHLAEMINQMTSMADMEIFDYLGFHQEEVDKIKMASLWCIQISAEAESEALRRQREAETPACKSKDCRAFCQRNCPICGYIQSSLQELECLVANKNECQDISEKVISILTNLANNVSTIKGEMAYNLVRHIVRFDINMPYEDLCLALCKMLMREESAAAMSHTSHDTTVSLHMPHSDSYSSRPQCADGFNDENDLPF